MRSVMPLIAAALLQACGTAAVTTLEESWASPQLPQQPFKKLLIISLAADDFVQMAFQDQMAAALKARGVNVVASKSYFSTHTTNAGAAKARFRQTIEDSGADYVLFARVTGSDTKSRDGHFMTFGDATGLYTAYDRYVSVARSQSDYSQKAITSEVSIFGVQPETLIWAARIRTDHPSAVGGKEYAQQYVPVVLEAMKKDRLF